jgi:hypothetical protein
MKFLPTAFVLIFIFCNSCYIERQVRIKKADKNSTANICEIHEKKMRKSIHLALYGYRLNCKINSPSEYPHAGVPKYMGCLMSKPREYFAIKYVCSKCNKARRQKRKNEGNNTE